MKNSNSTRMKKTLLINTADMASEEYGAGSFSDITSLADLLIDTTQRYSDLVAVTSTYQDADRFPSVSTPVEGQNYLSWTFSQTYAASRRLASYLKEKGVTPGTPIATILPNCPEWVLIFWAATIIQCPFVPLHPKTASKTSEIKYMLEKAGAGVLIVADSQMAFDLRENLRDCVSGLTVRLVISSNSITPDTWSTLSSALEFESSNSSQTSGSPKHAKRRSLTSRDVADKVSKWLKEKTGPKSPTFPTQNEKDASPKRSENDVSLILFTSGTTALPKMCPLSSTNIVAAAMRVRDARKLLPSHKMLQIPPLSHAFGFIFALGSWIAGASVVFPNPTFSAASILDSIVKTRATHTALVPTMAYGLIAEHQSSGNTKRDLSSLFSVDMAAAIVTKDLADTVKKELGVKLVFSSYGTTETSWHVGHSSESGPPEDDLVMSVGKATLFGHVRICALDDKIHKPLKRGEVGELHLGGYSVIKGYHGDVNASDFYQDVDSKGTKHQWFKTGDQAMMNSEGSIFVLGRYKDLIIRGGENISPATIEEYLNKFGVLSLVVGYPDEIAGEVPIAVIQRIGNADPSHESLLESTSRDLGLGFAPERILDLERDLGLDAFPTNTTGKLQKSALASAVKMFLDHETDDMRYASETDPSRPGTGVHFTEASSDTESDGNETPTEATLKRIWARITGRAARDFSVSSQISEFADSLMIIKFSGIVKKELRKNISASDIAIHDTIQAQARLLDCRSQMQRINETAKTTRVGPPTINELIHIKTGDTAEYVRNIEAVDRKLSSFRLSWQDVEDMTPVPDWCAAGLNQLRLQSWVVRQAFTTSMASCKQLVLALETVLVHHPLFRSFVVRFNEKPHFVITRPSARLFKTIIVTRHEVDTPEDVDKLDLYDENMDYAAESGPMFRAIVVHVRSTGTAGLIYHAAHSALDASSINLFNDDLGLALSGGRVVPRASFKKYADMYALYRESPKAKEDCEFHVKRLLGVGAQQKAIWPPERVPQQFRGSYHGWWKDLDGRIRDPEERPRLNPLSTPGIEGVNGTIQISTLNRLRTDLQVTAPVLLKAAIALFNVKTTGADEVTWGILDAARTWPVVDGIHEDKLEHATDIAGPTFEYMADRTKINKKETVARFLQRMQSQQTSLTTHAHAPTPIIASLLPPSDAQTISILMRRQAFNWPPGMLNSDFGPQNKPSLHRSAIHVDADVGFVWSGSLMGSETLFLNVSYDDAQVRRGEAVGWCEEVLAAAGWLGRVENWGVEVGGCGFGGEGVSML